MTTKKTDGKCVVCAGDLVEEVSEEFDARFGPMIIGPGSRNQFHEVSEGYHCKRCGLKYEFIPKIKPLTEHIRQKRKSRS